LIYALAPDKLIGLISAWTEHQLAFVPAAYRGLAVVPRLTHPTSDAGLDVLRAEKADLIVDYGDLGPDYVAKAERAQAALAVPLLLMDGRLAQIPNVLHSLGQILGQGDRAGNLADLAARALEKLRPVSTLPQEARPSVYLARGGDGLLAVRPGSLLSEAIEASGGRNVTPVGAGPFATLTPSEVAALDPDVVILEDPAAAEGPLPKALAPRAIILVDRGGPFGSMEEPPSINRLIGALALAAILHPDLVPPDIAFMRALREGFFGVLPKGASIMPLDRVR